MTNQQWWDQRMREVGLQQYVTPPDDVLARMRWLLANWNSQLSDFDRDFLRSLNISPL